MFRQYEKNKNIILNCEQIMNNLYDKSDIFTLLNILKKNFIQNKMMKIMKKLLNQ